MTKPTLTLVHTPPHYTVTKKKKSIHTTDQSGSHKKKKRLVRFQIFISTVQTKSKLLKFYIFLKIYLFFFFFFFDKNDRKTCIKKKKRKAKVQKGSTYPAAKIRLVAVKGTKHCQKKSREIAYYENKDKRPHP
jgi:hypothetical protein